MVERSNVLECGVMNGGEKENGTKQYLTRLWQRIFPN